RTELEQRIWHTQSRKIAPGDPRERRERVCNARDLAAEDVALTDLAAVEDEHDPARHVLDMHEVEARIRERHEGQPAAHEVAHETAHARRVAGSVHPAGLRDRD